MKADQSKSTKKFFENVVQLWSVKSCTTNLSEMNRITRSGENIKDPKHGTRHAVQLILSLLAFLENVFTLIEIFS